MFFAGLALGAVGSVLVFRLIAGRSAMPPIGQRASMVEAVIDNAVDAIITINRAGLIESFNPAATSLFGYQADEIIGQNVSLLMPEPHNDQHDIYLQNYYKTGKHNIIGIGREITCKRRDGSTFPADLAVSEMPDGHKACFTGILRDLSYRREIELKLDRSTRRMNLALQANHLLAWEYNVNRQKVRFSQRNITPDSTEPLFTEVDFSTAMDRVHPDDRKLIDAILSSRTVLNHVLPLEYRITDRKGRIRWVRNNFMLISKQADNREWIGISRDITDDRKNQNQLSSLGSILENSRNEVYVSDASSLKFLLVNRCARENLGYSALEILALTPMDLSQDMTDVEYNELLAPVRAGKKTGVSFKATYRRRDCTTYPIDAYLMPGTHAGRPVFVTIVLDITDEVEQLERLHQTEEELRLTLYHAPLGIVTLDTNGRILSLNKTGESMLGYYEADLIGTNSMNHLHEDERADALTAYSDLVGGTTEFSQSSHRVRHASGEYIVVQSHNAVVHDATGNPRRIISMFMDITQQRATEGEQQEQRQRLSHVARLGIMGEMAAGLAHEINQPLAAIATYARVSQRLIAKGDFNSADVEHAMTQVSAQAHRAGDVIKRIRALSKGASVQRKKMDIACVIEDLDPLISIDARNANIEVLYEIASNLPDTLIDPVQIQQVLLNLFRNSLDEVQNTGVSKRQLIIATRIVDNNMVEVSVRDYGPGVPEELIDRLFHPYFTTKESGMGMGLSISKSIILSHGGKIGYSPGNQGGAQFWFTIPIDS